MLKFSFRILLSLIFLGASGSYGNATKENLVEIPFKTEGYIDTAYSPVEQDSALKILKGNKELEWAFKYCDLFLGKYQYVTPFMEYVWNGSNLEVLNAANLIWSTLPQASQASTMSKWLMKRESFISDFSQKTNGDPAKYCMSMHKGIAKRTDNLDIRFPKESNLMHDVYSKYVKNESVKRNIEMTLGCVKKRFNLGDRDFTSAQRICNCKIDTILNNIDDGEIDSYINALSNSSSNHNNDLYKGIRPELDKCALIR